MQAIQIEMGKHAGKKIHPRLQTLLNEVHHFNPQFTYAAKDTMAFNGELQVDELIVLLGNQVIGVIAISTRYRRNDNEPVYIVRSDNIKRERQSSVASKHLKVVMKEVKENFKPQDADKRLSDIQSSISVQLGRMVRNANTHVNSAISQAATEVMMFLHKFETADTKPTALPEELTRKLGRDWKTLLDSARIANSVQTAFSQNRGVCVRIERDGKLAVVDLATMHLADCESTYDLATNYQEKITMLKLMDEHQPIEHVGARFEDWESFNGVRQDFQYFFLVSGNTYTNC